MTVPSREAIADLARELARHHLEEARTEGLPVESGDLDLLIIREAARILRGIATDVDAEADDVVAGR